MKIIRLHSQITVAITFQFCWLYAGNLLFGLFFGRVVNSESMFYPQWRNVNESPEHVTRSHFQLTIINRVIHFADSLFIQNILYPIIRKAHSTSILTHFQSSTTHHQIMNAIHKSWRSGLNRGSKLPLVSPRPQQKYWSHSETIPIEGANSPKSLSSSS